MSKPSFAARANKYAREIVAGKIDACLHVRQACQRHLDDLIASKAADYPYRFDYSAAAKMCRFAENMVHVKGKWAKSKIALEPWQVFLFSSAFGWLHKADGLRRFRQIYWEIPRKNGKSIMGAIIGLYMAFADGEAGSEVYSGASTEKQAWEVFKPARLMVLKNRTFREHFGIYVGAKNLACLDDGSKFEPVIGNPGDGPSPHCALVDEYHEQKTPDLFNTMLTGMGARLQPMLAVITTAGVDTSGPCYAKRDEAIKILSGAMQNDELFTIIYSIDEAPKDEDGKPKDGEIGDDWTQQAAWEKANPNYGVSVYESFLEARRREAIKIAHVQNDRKCKHLNIWSTAGSAWINMVTWKKNARHDIKMSDFEGMFCWLGVDLASKIDLTAMMFLFKWGDCFALFGKYYLPEDTINLPENDHYRRWRDEGHLIETPGARTDYRYLKDDLLEWDGKLKIQALAYDPRETEMLMQEIREEVAFPCVEVNQAPAQISEPMKEFEAVYTDGKLFHDGDPVLTWQASNVVLKNTKTKLFYPAKERNENKIDGIVAAIMALKMAMGVVEGPSVYEERGLIVLGE